MNTDNFIIWTVALAMGSKGILATWLGSPFMPTGALHNLAFSVSCAASVCAATLIHGICIRGTCIQVGPTKAHKTLGSFSCAQQQRGPFGFRFVQAITDIYSKCIHTDIHYFIGSVYAHSAQHFMLTQVVEWVLFNTAESGFTKVDLRSRMPSAVARETPGPCDRPRSSWWCSVYARKKWRKGWASSEVYAITAVEAKD